jgi:hypothetical protein
MYTRKQSIKDNITVAILVLIPVLIWTVYLVIKSNSVPSYADITENTSVSNTSNSSNDLDRLTTIVMGKISNRSFSSDIHGFITSIKFEPSSENVSFGSMILTQLGGHIVYTYRISGNNIDAKFYGSDNRRTASDQTLQYNESSDCVYVTVEGQQLAFK